MKAFIFLAGILTAFSVEAATPPPIPAAGRPGGALPQMTQPLPQMPSSESKLQAKPLMPIKETGQIIPVEKFKIIDVKAYPEKGITQEKIEALAETLRVKFLKTKTEKKESKNVKLTGLTLTDIQKIADSITLLYRSQGFIFTRVIIPPQEITHEHVVTLKVIEGSLGQVIPEGNKVYKNKILLWPFEKLTGKSVQLSQIETALLTINSYPGYSGAGIFTKGGKPLTTDLILKTQNEQRIRAAIGMDNNGSQLSGTEHGIASVTINNLTQGADQLSGMWIQNYDPKRGQYGGVAYSRLLFSPNLEMKLSYSRNGYSLGSNSTTDYSDLGFDGSANIYTASMTNTFIRSRLTTFSGTIDLSRKMAQTSYTDTSTNDNLAVGDLGFSLNRLIPSWRGYFTLDADVHQGFNGFLGAMGSTPDGSTPPSRQGGSGDYAQGRFTSYTADISYLQGFFQTQKLLLKVEGQYSSSLLTSLEQFSLGGVNAMRGFPTSEYLFDRGYYATAEWITPVPFISNHLCIKKYTWGQLLNFSAFVEAGEGWLNDPSTSDEEAGDAHANLYDYGLSMEFRFPQKFVFELQWAKPFGFSQAQPSDGKESRVWF